MTVTKHAGPARVLDDRDTRAVLDLLAIDPIANVFVSSRVELAGCDPWRLGAQLWGYPASGPLRSLCFAGANLVPVECDEMAVQAFTERARRQGRRCSSIVGPAEQVEAMWARLTPAWGSARDVRARQPLMATSSFSPVAADVSVRRVRPEELETILPACVSMFTEEVGVSPMADGGSAYRGRVAELVSAGRSFARIENGRVVFKAEVGAATAEVCQVQGVWVDPEFRGKGISEAGMAAVVSLCLRDVSPTISLYVNDFNAPARAAYERVGFKQVGTFASILF